MKQCLNNAPRERPSTEQLLTRLQGMRVEIEREYGTVSIRLDGEKLRLAKEVKAKDHRIRELQNQGAEQQVKKISKE